MRWNFICCATALIAFVSAPAAVSIADIDAAPLEHRAALKFLLDNMPERDSTSLTREFLFENVALALEARNSCPWGAAIPDEIFLNHVLPYASVNERRDNWRKDFIARFGPLVKDCKTPGDAALMLNANMFKQINVSYHPTKRPKPDQSPFESIEANYASCSGLSILLIDACRAVGVPARFVGTPSWNNGQADANGNHGGNHSWVEIWDGQWHVLGAIEATPLDSTWFLGNASKANPARAVNCIYAASFKKTGLSFPLVWDESIKYVPAEDVTLSYINRVKTKIQVIEKPVGPRVSAHLTLRLKGRLIADMDFKDTAEVTLSAGQEYQATVTGSDYDGAPQVITAPADSGRIVTIVLGR